MVFAAMVTCFALAFAWTAFGSEPAGGGHFTEYEYDDEGRVIGVVTVVDEAPPVISHIDPEVIRRGPAVSATIYGSGLRQAQIDTGHAGLTVSAVTSSATWVSFQLAADESVPLGSHTLTLTTTLGSDSVEVEVYPRLPVLQVSPDPAAITPGQELALSVGIDNADVVDHAFNLSSSNPSIAVISPAVVIIEAGQLAPQETITVSGVSLGTAALQIDTDEIADRQVPLFVTEPWQPPPGGADFYSPLLGVYVGEAPEPPRLVEFGPFVSRLGVVMPETPVVPPSHVDPLAAPLLGVNMGPVLQGLSPRNVVRGDGVVEVTASGMGLDQVAGVELEPADDVSVTLLSVVPDGTSLNLAVEAAAQAALGTRRLSLLTGTGESIPASGPLSDRLRVTDPVPVIESVDPLYLVQGDQNVELTVRGRLLGEVGQVRLVPGDGLVVGSTPQVAPDGRSLSIDIAVAADAPPGPRTVVVSSPAGSSDGAPSVYNTVEVVTEIAGQVTPVVAPLLGVTVDGEDGGSDFPVELASAPLGVTTGAMLDGLAPSAAGAGTEFTLTVSGSELQGATDLRFEPDDGIAIPDWSSASDGTSLTASVAIAIDAARTVRRVVVETAAGIVVAAGPTADRFRVTEQGPEIHSVSPILLQVDSGPTPVRIRGVNLHDAFAAELLPPGDFKTGIPVAAGDGTYVDVDITVLESAQPGPRTMVVHTPAGATDSTASTANTVHFVTGIESTVTPLTAPLLGVQLGDPSTPPQTEVMLTAPLLGVDVAQVVEPELFVRDIRSSALGMTVGPAVTGLEPRFLPVDSEHELSIVGTGLSAVDQVVFDPDDGIESVAGPVADPGGESVGLTITVAPEAPETVRRVAVIANNQVLPAASSSAATLRVVGTEPAITSIAPIQAIPGDTIALVIRGFNLFGVTAVTAEPATGLTFDANPSGNPSGTEVTVNVTISSGAPAGPRAIRVHAAGGVTPADATPANTLNILGE